MRARGELAEAGVLGRVRAIRVALDPVQMALLLVLLSILVVFILYPLLQVLAVSFTAAGRLSLIYLRKFFPRVSTATPKGQRPFPPGATVTVCFDPADVILIPPEAR